MNKILGIAMLSLMTACNDSGAGTENDNGASMQITNGNKDITVSVGNAAANTFLIINGKALDAASKTAQIVIDESFLKPGPNDIWLVSGKDTVKETSFFSYKLEYQLVKEYKHDITNFAQGLFIEGNILYESTGLEGKSKIARYQIGENDFTLINEVKNDPSIFGEGIAAIGNNLYQLSWENRVVLEYDKTTLKKKNQYKYDHDGWGLTPNGDSLIASDGSEYLYFINPAKFEVYKKIAVQGELGPVKQLNELELVGNMVIANVWQTNTIVFIDKHTGIVSATADLSALANTASQENPNRDVLNGIAYDAADGTFLVTGKLWTKVYRIKFDEILNKLIGK